MARTTTTQTNEATTQTNEVKAQRMSKLERLKLELAAAQAKEQEKKMAKVQGIEAKLAAAEANLVKATERVNAVKAELAEAIGEGPLLTDGVGELQPEVDETVEPEVDETVQA